MFLDDLTYLAGPSAIADDGHKVQTYAAKVRNGMYLPAFKKITPGDEHQILTDILNVSTTLQGALDAAKRLAETYCHISRSGFWEEL